MKLARYLFSAVLFLAGCGDEPQSNSGSMSLDPALDSTLDSGRTVKRFVGSERCADCHQQAYDLWRGSHHQLAMAEATDANVVGDFEDARFDYFGQESRFQRDNSGFTVTTPGKTGDLSTYRVTHTFGVAPLQQYLLDLGDGRKQALPIALG